MYPAWKSKSCSLWHGGRKIKMSLGTQVGTSSSYTVTFPWNKMVNVLMHGQIHREGWGIVPCFSLLPHPNRSCLHLSCLLEHTPPEPPLPKGPHLWCSFLQPSFIKFLICSCHVSWLWNLSKLWMDNRFNPKYDQHNDFSIWYHEIVLFCLTSLDLMPNSQNLH